jgi:hypothetical protein
MVNVELIGLIAARGDKRIETTGNGRSAGEPAGSLIVLTWRVYAISGASNPALSAPVSSRPQPEVMNNQRRDDTKSEDRQDLCRKLLHGASCCLRGPAQYGLGD